ncbi:hypothetical protein FH608_016855 [Nonomuraea phyllanthi]|uniref:Uncharacterized protein n=1 Tax=Nonomuraea phyllanthi TaxID=2219224 RepID=A0A5C4WME4_9ACTN|nr:hypothetical protein [Nonomuraea phyllanthi]KAB8194828.1 hypothetical protein FH608_016855 [Nonomuraea phyllanthi]
MNRRADRWASLYGAGPWHLLGLAACFVFAGYVVSRVVGAGIWMGFAAWFVGAVVLHDLVLWPLYSAGDSAVRSLSRPLARLGRARPDGRRPALVNHVRVPVGLACLLLLVWAPLILGGAEPNYRAAVGLSTSPYLARWLWVALVLAGVSGLLYALRRWAAGRNAARAARDASPRP